MKDEFVQVCHSIIIGPRQILGAFEKWCMHHSHATTAILHLKQLSC
jgi:hypothetical protein